MANHQHLSQKRLNKNRGDEEVITCRPADLLKPELHSLEKEIQQYAKSEEDVLLYAMFPQQGKDF